MVSITMLSGNRLVEKGADEIFYHQFYEVKYKLNALYTVVLPCQTSTYLWVSWTCEGIIYKRGRCKNYINIYSH